MSQQWNRPSAPTRRVPMPGDRAAQPRTGARPANGLASRANTRPANTPAQRANVRPATAPAPRANARPTNAPTPRTNARSVHAPAQRAYNRPGYAPVQQNRPRPSEKASVKKTPFLQKAGKAALAVVKAIGIVLMLVFGYVSSFIKAVNKKLNVFRKTEAAAVITNCAVGAVLISILLIIFLLLKPSMDASRARSLAAKGRAAEAVRITQELRRTGYNEEKLFETEHTVADRLIDAGSFEEAREVLSAMEKNSRTDELHLKLDYNYAKSLYAKGEYSAAAQLFYQMQAYMDSLDMYYNCRCALAVNAFLNGQEHQVQSMLLEIPNVSARVKGVLGDMMVGQDDNIASRLTEAFSEEKLRDFEQMVTILSAARENMQKGRIAAGFAHTLGLTRSGFVMAAGDNTYGQLNVQIWANVKQVAAGAYHSVALFNDGTVAAVGDNSVNQLDVSSWTDIVAIAASAYDTIGLKSDGSVVACGMHADLVSRWHGVTLISGGAHAMGCLYDKGYMMATHSGAQMDASIALFDLSVSGGASAGILYDGSLITTFENAPAWTDLVSIELSPAGLFAIDANGNVLTYFYNPADQIQVSLPAAASEIASGGTHHVFLTKDGRVYAYGDNRYGQLNTQSWNLEE